MHRLRIICVSIVVYIIIQKVFSRRLGLQCDADALVLIRGNENERNLRA